MPQAHAYQEDPRDPGYCRCGLAKGHPEHYDQDVLKEADKAAEIARLRSNLEALLKELGTWATCKDAGCLASGYWITTRQGKVFYEPDGSVHFPRCKGTIRFERRR